MRSRSRWNAGRIGSSGSGRTPALAVGALRRLRRQDRVALARLRAVPRMRHGGRRASSPGLAEARAVRQRRHAEDLGERLPEIGECRARRRDRHRPRAGAEHQQRHVLARVVGAGRRRIVAVIGGDDQQIVRPQLRQQLGQPRVEALEIARRSRRRRCDVRTACRSRRGSRRSARAAPADRASTRPCRRRRWRWTASSTMPRPANRSSILPIACTGDAGRVSRSSSVSAAAAARSRGDWRSA